MITTSTSRWTGLMGLAIAGVLASAARADLLVGTFNGSSVQRYDESTGSLTLTGQVASGSGGLSAATGVAFGPDGNLYVSSRSTGKILKYNGATGASMGVFATLPPDPNPLGGNPVTAAPAYLKFGVEGDLYVSDSGGSNVERFNGTSGAFTANVVTGMLSPGSFAFAANGDIFVNDFGASKIYHHAAGAVATQKDVFVDLTDTTKTPAGPNFFLGGRTPSGILIGSAGDVYVTDLFQNQLLHYTSAGALIGNPVTVNVPGQPIPQTEQFPSNAPTNLMFDRTGKILIANGGYSQSDPKGTVVRYNANLTDPSLFAASIPTATSLALTLPTFVSGDVNGDGVVNNFDIAPFELALTGLNQYFFDHPLLTDFRHRGDINGDGVFDNFDIPKFEQLLTTRPGAALVPEPSGLALVALAALGGVAVLANRRKR